MDKALGDEIERLRADAARTAEAVAQARRDALEEAAKAVEGGHYLLSLMDPKTGPFTRMDQVCKETREQAAAGIRALAERLE